MQSASSIENRFSHAAASYESYTGVQHRVAGEVAGLFAGILPAHRVLEVGCGSGLLTKLICERLKDSGTTFVALDLSKAMLDRTRRKLRAGHPAQWIHGDFLAYRPDGLFDCISSSSTLHWIMPLDLAMEQCRRLLAPKGHLIFGMMVAGTLAELHSARRHIAPRTPVKDPLPAREEVEAILARHGFKTRTRRVAAYREEFESARMFLKTLHDRGVTGGGISHGDRLLNRAEIRNLTQWYETQHPTESGGVFATYKVLFIHATRGNP